MVMGCSDDGGKIRGVWWIRGVFNIPSPPQFSPVLEDGTSCTQETPSIEPKVEFVGVVERGLSPNSKVLEKIASDRRTPPSPAPMQLPPKNPKWR